MRHGTQRHPARVTTMRSSGRRLVAGAAATALGLAGLVALGPAGPAAAALEPTGAGNVCEAPPEIEPFDDVGETDPARDEIECLHNVEITTGVTATTYEPNSPVTRRHMVLFLHRFADVVAANDIDGAIEALPAGDGEVPFTDIGAQDLAFAEVDALADVGVVEGFDDGTFRPNEEVTRRQMAKFLVRIQETLAGADILPTDPPDAFGDDEGDSGEAELDILAAEEVFEGDADGNVNPGDDISRRQMAFVLTRKLQYLHEQGLIDQLFVDGSGGDGDGGVGDGGDGGDGGGGGGDGGGDGGDGAPSLAIAGGPTETTEAGGSDTFTVALSQEPTADVNVQIESDDPGEAVAAPTEITLTQANWNAGVTVVVTGVDDVVDDGDISHPIGLTVDDASSADEFDGASVTVSNTNVDDDESPEFMSATSGSAGQNSITATFSEPVACPSVDLNGDFEVRVDAIERVISSVSCAGTENALVVVNFGGELTAGGEEVELKLLGQVSDAHGNTATLTSHTDTVQGAA